MDTLSIEKAAIVVWLMPTRIWCLAEGTSTSQKRWRDVQPLMAPDSEMSLGTVCRPRSVFFTMGGIA